MARPTALRALADRLGILASYLDVDDAEHATTDDTRVALLHAMGIDAADDAAAGRALEQLLEHERDRLLEPVAVAADHVWQLPTSHIRDGTEWSMELVLEDGTRHTMEGTVGAGRAAPTLPEPLPLGYHELRLSVSDAAGTREGTQTLIVPPRQCTSVETSSGRHRAVGILVNLYSVRSDENWGCGDVADLRRIAAWGHRHGAAFVGINPLHALGNRRAGISPYSPLSRLYRNPIYLDVPALPEVADSPEAGALFTDSDVSETRNALRAAELVDYEGVMRLKRRLLEPLHRAFAERHRDRGTPRGTAYRRYRDEQGEALDRFAVFCALAEQMPDAGAHGPVPDWHGWPAPLRDPGSTAVRDFARANAELVDYHRWLQFALDEQLAGAGDALSLGIYRDLAVGSSPGGYDTWAWPALFARDATIGAPPDDFSADGQDWNLPPQVPHALRDDRYRYWIRLLRAGFAHGGALRLDHVMGLLRLFWVPAGSSPRQGAYVRYPGEEMMAVVALESRRHGAPVVGENLGTVSREVSPALRRWGMLSSAVLYFERDDGGSYLPPEAYPARALVSAGTHDHVPLAGFWTGRDIEIHRAIGLVADDAEYEQVRTDRDRDRAALAAALADERLLTDETDADPASVVRAVHGFLARTPSAMVGVSLDDLALETVPVNVPGTDNDRYPNWRRKMRLSVEELDETAPAASLRAAFAEPPARTAPSASPSRSGSLPADQS